MMLTDLTNIGFLLLAAFAFLVVVLALALAVIHLIGFVGWLVAGRRRNVVPPVHGSPASTVHGRDAARPTSSRYPTSSSSAPHGADGPTSS